MTIDQYPHAVARLKAIRKAKSTKPFLARGHQVVRCPRCRLDERYCICFWQPPIQCSKVGMCLLMYDSEPFKPTNTGWLIADIVPNTFAYSWTRTGNMAEVKALIEDPIWQPYLVFPEEYANQERVTKQIVSDKKPLFILLDGTWSEARKMFRKSLYLDNIPVLSLNPNQNSRYKLRRSIHAEHLSTAEVAMLCLELANEKSIASVLDIWFGLFTEHYLAARETKPIDINNLLHKQALTMQSN